jgi:transcriptional regulator with XRE-family HTH domain
VLVSPRQCKAARSLLGWTQKFLAIKANVCASTIENFETGKRIPITVHQESIRRCFQKEGLRFVFGGVIFDDP